MGIIIPQILPVCCYSRFAGNVLFEFYPTEVLVLSAAMYPEMYLGEVREFMDACDGMGLYSGRPKNGREHKNKKFHVQKRKKQKKTYQCDRYVC